MGQSDFHWSSIDPTRENIWGDGSRGVQNRSILVSSSVLGSSLQTFLCAWVCCSSRPTIFVAGRPGEQRTESRHSHLQISADPRNLYIVNFSGALRVSEPFPWQLVLSLLCILDSGEFATPQPTSIVSEILVCLAFTNGRGCTFQLGLPWLFNQKRIQPVAWDCKWQTEGNFGKHYMHGFGRKPVQGSCVLAERTDAERCCLPRRSQETKESFQFFSTTVEIDPSIW